MSTQRGNSKKSGPPKHQNKTKFKNNMHDTSGKTKMINSLELTGVCAKCKEVIEWKIKYKKYKPLTTSKKCVKCQQKAVKRAYYIVCQPCAEQLKVCARCGQSDEIVQSYGLSASEEARRHSELNAELRGLPERKRRAFFRAQEKGFPEDRQGSVGYQDMDENVKTCPAADSEECEARVSFEDDSEQDVDENALDNVMYEREESTNNEHKHSLESSFSRVEETVDSGVVSSAKEKLHDEIAVEHSNTDVLRNLEEINDRFNNACVTD